MKTYNELIQAVKEEETAENLMALGEWFEHNGSTFWNGECYDTEKDFDGYNLYPIYEENDGDFEIVGYELKI